MRHLCILIPAALLLSACGGSGGGGGSTGPILLPALVSEAIQPGMLASNDDAEYPAISGNGLFVAFQDESGNLVPGDTNNEDDVGLYDVTTGVLTHASRTIAGAVGNDDADRPAFDLDGSHLAFESDASNLVAGDTNDRQDVFVRNLLAHTIVRASVASDGTQAQGGSSGDPVLNADGTVVAFDSSATNLVPSDANSSGDVFVRDLNTGTTTRVSVSTAGVEGDDWSGDPAISADGNLVVFESRATNLVAGDANGASDIFLHNRTTGTTIRISVDTGGGDPDSDSYDPRISADGAIVVFESWASDLVAGDTNNASDVFVYVVASGLLTRVSVDSVGVEGLGNSDSADVSGTGQYVVFSSQAPNLVAGDTNGLEDVFRHDRQTGTTIRVNVRADGSQSAYGSADDCAVSHDGMRVVWDQGDCGLVPDDVRVAGNSNVFLKNLGTGVLTLVSTAADRSRADGRSGGNYDQAVSANGQWIVFASRATNLVAGDTNGWQDLFRREVATGTITRVLATPPPNANDFEYASLGISNDGRWVCFSSRNPDLLGPGIDTNSREDVFVLDTTNGMVELISKHTDNTPGNNDSYDAKMTPDGRYVLFTTWATTLFTGDVLGNGEVALRDRTAGTTERAVLDKDGLPIEELTLPGGISDDGRYVAFDTTAADVVESDTNSRADVFRRDRQSGTNLRVSVDSAGVQATNHSDNAFISGDGSAVLFRSSAPDLVADDTNSNEDLFVRDITVGTTTRVSVTSAGAQIPTGNEYETIDISFDGDIVLFRSDAAEFLPAGLQPLPRLFVHVRSTGATFPVGLTPSGAVPATRFAGGFGDLLSGDGRTVIYSMSRFEVTELWSLDLSPVLGN